MIPLYVYAGILLTGVCTNRRVFVIGQYVVEIGFRQRTQNT